jgi:serine/threonine protein kinase
VQSLEREYEMMCTLDHPNIIKVYQCEQRFCNYYIMEMELGGETLEQYQKHRQMTEEECALVMKGIFNALSYLHDELNVIHRDLKPENIVVCDYDDLSRVKLIDFGLAVEYSHHNIKDYANCGTILYTPPE